MGFRIRLSTELAVLCLLAFISATKNAYAQEDDSDLASCRDELPRSIELPTNIMLEMKPKRDSSGTLIRKFSWTLPVPINYCLKTGKTILLHDPYGQSFAKLTIDKTWRGLFTVQRVLGNLSTLPVADQFLRATKAMDVDPVGLISAIQNFSFKNNLFDSQRQIGLANGELEVLQDYFFDDRNIQGRALPADVKAIGYNELIDRLASKSSVYTVFGSESDSNGDVWRVPTAKPGLPSGTDGEKKFIGGLELTRYTTLSRAEALKDCLNKPVVFYGEMLVGPTYFNFRDWLKSVGCNKIEWYRGGKTEWISANAFEVEDRLRWRHLDATQVLSATAAGSDALIIDLRSPFVFAEGHLPKAANMPMLVMTERPSVKAPNMPVFLLFSDDLGQAIKNLMPGKKRIVFYYDEPNVQIARNLTRFLRYHAGRVKLEPYIYTGGYRDWKNRNEWLGDASGFRIETSPAPKTELAPKTEPKSK